MNTISHKHIDSIRNYFPDNLKLIENGYDIQYYIMEYLEEYKNYVDICGDENTENWDAKICPEITGKICAEADKFHKLCSW